jgi:hypothetical protein
VNKKLSIFFREIFRRVDLILNAWILPFAFKNSNYLGRRPQLGRVIVLVLQNFYIRTPVKSADTDRINKDYLFFPDCYCGRSGVFNFLPG